jgi:hypothetical protein
MNTCECRPEPFSSKQELKKHKSKDCLLEKEACPHCSVLFSKTKIHRHIKLASCIRDCADCGEVFSSKQALAKHRTKSCGFNLVYCPNCDEGFQKDKLLKHISDEVCARVCKDCNLTFDSKLNLINHKNACTGGKMLECEACDRLFESPGRLEQHLEGNECEQDRIKEAIKSSMLYIAMRNQEEEQEKEGKACLIQNDADRLQRWVENMRCYGIMGDSCMDKPYLVRVAPCVRQSRPVRTYSDYRLTP